MRAHEFIRRTLAATLVAVVALRAPDALAAFSGTGALPVVGGGTNTTTGAVTVPVGSTAAGSAPIYFVAGTLMSIPEAGAIEADDSLKLYYTPSSTRERIFTSVAQTNCTVDPPSTVNKAVWESNAFTINGLATGDPVIYAATSALEAGLIWCAYPSAATGLKVRVANLSGSTLNPASHIWKASYKH